MFEHFFQCPYCWEEISMILDPFDGRQLYVEDCEVCCNPIEIDYRFESAEIIDFEAREIGQ
jgi:hypothetical protein